MGESLSDSQFAASKLFHEIWTRHGEAEARRIFAECCEPTTPKTLAEIRNIKLLALYDSMVDDNMKPDPNVQKLALLLAKENEKLPRADRHGPRGTTNPQTLDKHFRRLLRERKARHRAYQAKKALKRSSS